MRALKYLFLVLVAIVLVTIALANREEVAIQLLPAEMASYLGQPLSLQVPLFVVIFGAIIVGLLIGFVWEWFREHSVRVEARQQKHEREVLEREVKGLRAQKHKGKDEVLAILDDPALVR